MPNTAHDLLWNRLLEALKVRNALPADVGNSTPLEIARYADERLRTNLAVPFVEGYYLERRYGESASKWSEAEAEALVLHIESISPLFSVQVAVADAPVVSGTPALPGETGTLSLAEGFKPAASDPVPDESQAWGTEYVAKSHPATRPAQEAEEAERLRQEENARRAEAEERNRRIEQESREQEEEDQKRRIEEERKRREQEEERKRWQEEENRKEAEERDRLWEESRRQYQQEVRQKAEAVRQRFAETERRAGEAAKASLEGRRRAAQDEPAASRQEAELAQAKSRREQALFQSHSELSSEKPAGVSPAKVAWWIVLIILTPIYWLCAFLGMFMIGMSLPVLLIFLMTNETVHRTMTLNVATILFIVGILISLGLMRKSINFFEAVFLRILWEPIRRRIAQ